MWARTALDQERAAIHPSHIGRRHTAVIPALGVAADLVHQQLDVVGHPKA